VSTNGGGEGGAAEGGEEDGGLELHVEEAEDLMLGGVERIASDDIMGERFLRGFIWDGMSPCDFRSGLLMAKGCRISISC
jgi:hypothetical protein